MIFLFILILTLTGYVGGADSQTEGAAGEVLKNLYERGFLDRKSNIKVKKHYSYYIVEKGRKELEHLPPYNDILKNGKILKNDLE